MTPNRVIALGFFDGVHIGHGALLKTAVKRAKALGVTAAALTFDIHPEALVFGRALPLINTMADREALMKELYGIDEVIFDHFDEHMMKMPWEEFITGCLIRDLGAVHVVCGHDYHFGYKGEGSPERLKEKCEALGLGCDIVKKVDLEGITVSSTHIRDLISDGAMESAARFLGHPHRISGVVEKGRGLGRTLGIPTANLTLQKGIVEPARGVYACKAIAGGKAYPAVTNIGVRPTVDSSGTVTVEAHIIGFNGDLYGQLSRVDFYRYLRPEKKFADVEALKTAIFNDIESTKRYFAREKTPEQSAV